MVFLQGTAKVRSEAVEALPKKKDLKDDDLVFVAGATGRVGSRTVRLLSAFNSTLYKLSFNRMPDFQKTLSFHDVFQGTFETWVPSQSWCEECTESRNSCASTSLIVNYISLLPPFFLKYIGIEKLIIHCRVLNK